MCTLDKLFISFNLTKMSCNSYAFDTECTKETRSLLFSIFALFVFSLSGFKLITINLLVTNKRSGKKSEIHTVISTVVKKINKINVVAYERFLASLKMARF